MGKVLDLANKEYDILQEVRQAIDSIDREERFEKRYLDELKEDLQKIIYYASLTGNWRQEEIDSHYGYQFFFLSLFF